MARFTKSKTSGQVRLRKWPPGRVNQLKIMLATLDKAANASLAGQITQTGRREFSPFVPKIVLTTASISIEFREVRIAFDPPQGLRRFLFYEFQQSEDANFSTYESFLTPEPYYTFSNLLDEGTYYFRVRVVTTNALHGPWSETGVGITPSAKAIGLFDISSFTNTVISSNFTTLISITYNNAVGGTIFYSIEYEITALVAGATVNISDIEFRWIVDSDQQGQNFLVTAYSIDPFALSVRCTNLIQGNGTPAYSSIPAWPYTRSGTFIQRPHNLTAGNHVIYLQARNAGLDFRPAPNEPAWADSGGAGLPVTYTNGSVVNLKNFGAFEIRTGAI